MSYAAANDTNDFEHSLRELIGLRTAKRLRGGPLAAFTGGPKGQFVFLRDRSRREEPILLLSGAIDRSVPHSEEMLARAVLGDVEVVRGDWRRTQFTVTFFVEEGDARPAELGDALDEAADGSWNVAVALVPTALRGAA